MVIHAQLRLMPLGENPGTRCGHPADHQSRGGRKEGFIHLNVVASGDVAVSDNGKSGYRGQFGVTDVAGLKPVQGFFRKPGVKC